ncbi:hypothetical protein NP493_1658g00003 [Ridgeia piscesae]|uniref:NACHT domain-containing protein n=1 Tax=Ridgeia piscesae TaxID=27915 RepID=A0AAD9JVN1_RIDPI|nr:hypothetical protein NP493_1658g00003 [Ridgeia piscesae]
MEKFLKDTHFFKSIVVDEFSDMYIEPVVYESNEYKRLDTRANINCLTCQMDIGQCERVKVEELILPDPESGSAPKVLVTGSAGSGKTMLSMYLLNMWLEGKLSAFKNVFIYSMKELSRVEEMTSLGDLLFMHQYIYQRPTDEIAVDYVHMMSENTLVVFDGLDAFGSYSWETETFDCNEKVEMSKLIGSIVSGHTLSQVTLLVTSRPGGVDEYKKFHQIAEIYGFDETMIDRYVEMYCQGEVTLKYHIDNFIKSNINVSSLCHLPIFCYLLCEMGKIGLERDREAPFPTTMTQLIAKCVENFMREQHPDFSGKELGRHDVVADVREQLLAHSKLAKDGMSHQPVKVVFSNKDIKNIFQTKDVTEFSQKTATQCGFVNVATERKDMVVHKKVTQSYFVHLLMHEFCAAIALVSSLEDIEKLLDQTPNEGQLDMVLAFIAGLVGDPDNKTFLESLGYDATTKVANPIHKKKLDDLGYNLVITTSELLELVVIQCDNEQAHRRRRDHKASILLLLRLLYESREPYLWSEIKAFVLRHREELDLSGTEITPADLQALTYVAQKTSDIRCVE